MLLLLFISVLLPHFICASTVLSKNNVTYHASKESSSVSLGDAVVNVQHFTQFTYEGNQVYIYSAKLNDEYDHQPLKWSFYYVPILQPVKSSVTTDWAWMTKKEVRIKLILGNDQIEDAARRVIAHRFDAQVAANYSRFWIVAPLMIDSIMGFVVKMSGDPVEGVAPYHLVHPNALAIVFRFECSHADMVQGIVEKLIEGDYEIEVNLYFAGFKRGSFNIISITGEQIRSVLSKAMADGGNSNAKYIHRKQANKFIAKYTSNVRRMIYMEKPNAEMSALTSGLDEQFTALFHQGMNSATEIQLSAKLYDQVWHSTDLHPDRLTNELNKLFILNNTATRVYNNTDTFFNINSESTHSSSSASQESGDLSLVDIFSASGSSSETNNQASSRNDDQTKHNIMSASDIQKRIAQYSIEIEWTGEKFEVKSFHVFKLADVTDKLQVAIISKYMYAEKQNGAISRRVSVLNQPITMAASCSSNIFTGEIRLFAGALSPPFNWLVCNGSLLSRIDYPRLFDVIGTLYGTGNEDETQFRLPDLRGRVPVGVDEEGVRVTRAKSVGAVGGQTEHALEVGQLPSHDHDRGHLNIEHSGEHTHTIHDPGHYHDIPYNLAEGLAGSRFALKGSGWVRYVIPRTAQSKTGIAIDASGSHGHGINGRTGSTGGGQKFSLLQPFQTLNYIIYVGK